MQRLRFLSVAFAAVLIAGVMGLVPSRAGAATLPTSFNGAVVGASGLTITVAGGVATTGAVSGLVAVKTPNGGFVSGPLFCVTYLPGANSLFAFFKITYSRGPVVPTSGFPVSPPPGGPYWGVRVPVGTGPGQPERTGANVVGTFGYPIPTVQSNGGCGFSAFWIYFRDSVTFGQVTAIGPPVY